MPMEVNSLASRLLQAAAANFWLIIQFELSAVLQMSPKRLPQEENTFFLLPWGAIQQAQGVCLHLQTSSDFKEYASVILYFNKIYQAISCQVCLVVSLEGLNF